jgi:hypothetical protein
MTHRRHIKKIPSSLHFWGWAFAARQQRIRKERKKLACSYNIGMGSLFFLLLPLARRLMVPVLNATAWRHMHSTLESIAAEIEGNEGQRLARALSLCDHLNDWRKNGEHTQELPCCRGDMTSDERWRACVQLYVRWIAPLDMMLYRLFQWASIHV